MANKDLRDWISDIESAGELKIIKGAEPKEEIGGFVDIYKRKMGNPALHVRRGAGISERPSRHRQHPDLGAAHQRRARIARQASEIELIQWWRNYMKNAPSHKPKAVNGGPLLDNVLEGNDVNIQSIPTPVWHERDGGPFIGTACMVAMKDPDTGWINYGSYRVQSQGPNVATVFMSPGKHGLHHHAQVSRAQTAVSRGGDRRHASRDVHAGGARNSLRQERARGRGRHPRRACRSPQHAANRTSGAGKLRNRVRRLHPSRTTSYRKGRSANGPATILPAAIWSPLSASRR